MTLVQKVATLSVVKEVNNRSSVSHQVGWSSNMLHKYGPRQHRTSQR
jgi:hypothetical protein